MSYSLQIASRSTGLTYEVASIVKSDVTWTTERIGAPGRLEFTLIKDYTAAYHEGDPVMLAMDGIVLFRGYVFTKRKSDNGEIQTVCYDQLRYLKARQTYNWEDYSLADAVRHIANDFQLQAGELPDTGYKLPYGHYQDKTLLDIIFDYQARTTIATGTIWNFFDEDGALVLRKASDMESPYVIGAGSLATGFTYETSIDKDTYNLIKLVRPNEETGRADVYQAQDEENIARWGLLQLYEIVDETLNAAQIEEMVRQRLTYHNRVSRSLTLPAVGIPSIRAGCIVPIYLPDLGDLSLSQKLLVDRVTHKLGTTNHTMTLEMEVIT